VTLHTYGLMVAIGYLTAILLAARSGHRFGVTSELVLDAAFYVIVFSIIGGRSLYVLVNWSYYVEKPLEILYVHHGGLVYFGGYIAASLGIYFWLRRKGVNPWNYGDLMSPFVALGHALGRIGCFLNGCCYGRVSDGAFSVVFPSLGDGLARLPMQLVSSLTNLALFAFLLLSWRWRKFRGQVVWTYVLAYSCLRFLLEFLRDDQRGALFGTWLSTSQSISLAGMLLGALMLVRWRNDPSIRIGSPTKSAGERRA
jgi:phosphatidylglycerol:prolipoprotein diacylglycerol transferase